MGGLRQPVHYWNPLEWSFWGLFGVDNPNAAVKTYTARKNFYTLAQISKFVRPGAQRIGVSGSVSSLSPLLAFNHAGLGQITIVGINTSSSAATLSGALASLPTVSYLDLYYTSATTNLADGGSVAVNNGAFSATIPADCVFTLTGWSGLRVAITNPLSGSSFNAPATIPIFAAATTSTGSVAKVEFYTGSAKVGESTNLPYRFTWTNVPNGRLFTDGAGHRHGGQFGDFGGGEHSGRGPDSANSGLPGQCGGGDGRDAGVRGHGQGCAGPRPQSAAGPFLVGERGGDD